MSCTYNYNVPCVLIWIYHILIGLFLIYLGYLVVEKKNINKYVGITLFVIGVLAILYNLHLWYTKRNT